MVATIQIHPELLWKDKDYRLGKDEKKDVNRVLPHNYQRLYIIDCRIYDKD